MKHAAFLYLTILLLTHNAWSQNSKPIRVKAGNDIKEVLTAEYLYRYPQFISGNVIFKNGGKSVAKLNYNLLISEMQFIDPKGDTLSLANEETFNFITVGNDTFYFDKGYMEKIAGNSAAMLGRKHVIRMDEQKIGGYDQPSSSSSVTSFNTLNMDNKSNKLTVREDVVLSKAALYYFGDINNHFLPANKKNLLKMFAKHQKDIEKYLDENPVNYNKEEDLKKLFDFLKNF